MDTVIVKNSQFYSHCQKRIAKGNVNAEKIEIRLDSEWDGLTVRIHWLNVTSKVEKKPLLERDKPNTIPWEVLADLGELHMGLVGLDGETVIKPTIWLTYGYVVDGVDPESGSDPQPPTPSWEQQMVEQATQAKQAAQAAQQAAEAAAAILPKPTPEDAGKVPLVNPEGTGYIFGEAGGSRGEFERIMEINVTEDDVSVIERDLGAEYSSVIISTIDFDKGNKTPEPTAITTTGNLYLWLKNSKNTNDRQIRLTVTGTLTINKRNTSICVENKGIVWKASGVINQVYSVLGGSNTDGQQIQTYIPVLQGETTSVDTLILTAYQGAFLNGCNLYVYGVRS